MVMPGDNIAVEIDLENQLLKQVSVSQSVKAVVQIGAGRITEVLS